MEIELEITENKLMTIPDDTDLGRMILIFNKQEEFKVQISKSGKYFYMF